MSVHIGRITSEVTTSAPVDAGAGDEQSDQPPDWEERARLAAVLERLTTDRLRTATGLDA